MKIIESILTNNPCYKAGQKIKVKGLMLHSVGCPQPSATVFVKNWNNSSFGSACVHGFIDANDGTVYQTLPWDHRGWHGGGSSNNTHIGVEMCEPDCIKYTSGANFTCSNKERAKEMATRTYNSAVELFAYLCKKYGLNPTADGVIVSHAEGYKRGIASGHADPEHLWSQLGMSYTMDGFRKDVKAAMNGDFTGGETTTTQTEKPATSETATLYRVQVGAYSKKANAEAMLAKLKKAGFDAFITTSGGKVIADPEPVKKSVDEIAREVIQGKWGNGDDRKNRLTAAGYDYSTIRKRVNELLGR